MQSVTSQNVDACPIVRLRIFRDLNRDVTGWDCRNDEEGALLFDGLIRDCHGLFDGEPFISGAANKWLYVADGFENPEGPVYTVSTQDIFDRFHEMRGLAAAYYYTQLVCLCVLGYVPKSYRRGGVTFESGLTPAGLLISHSNFKSRYDYMSDEDGSIPRAPVLRFLEEEGNGPYTMAVILAHRKMMQEGHQSHCCSDTVKELWTGCFSGPASALKEDFEANRRRERNCLARLGELVATRPQVSAAGVLKMLVAVLLCEQASGRTLASPAGMFDFSSSATMHAPSLWQPTTWRAAPCGYVIVNATQSGKAFVYGKAYAHRAVAVTKFQARELTPCEWMAKDIVGNNTKAYLEINERSPVFKNLESSGVRPEWLNVTELCSCGVALMLAVTSKVSMHHIAKFQALTAVNPLEGVDAVKASMLNNTNIVTDMAGVSPTPSAMKEVVPPLPIWVFVVMAIMVMAVVVKTTEAWIVNKENKRQAMVVERLIKSGIKPVPVVTYKTKIGSAINNFTSCCISVFSTVAVASVIGRTFASITEGITLVAIVSVIVVFTYLKNYVHALVYVIYLLYIGSAVVYYRPSVEVSDEIASVGTLLSFTICVALAVHKLYAPIPFTFVLWKGGKVLEGKKGKIMSFMSSSGIEERPREERQNVGYRGLLGEFIDDLGPGTSSALMSALQQLGEENADLDYLASHRDEIVAKAGSGYAMAISDFLDDVQFAKNSRMSADQYMDHIGDNRWVVGGSTRLEARTQSDGLNRIAAVHSLKELRRHKRKSQGSLDATIPKGMLNRRFVFRVNTVTAKPTFIRGVTYAIAAPWDPAPETQTSVSASIADPKVTALQQQIEQQARSNDELKSTINHMAKMLESIALNNANVTATVKSKNGTMHCNDGGNSLVAPPAVKNAAEAAEKKQNKTEKKPESAQKQKKGKQEKQSQSKIGGVAMKPISSLPMVFGLIGEDGSVLRQLTLARVATCGDQFARLGLVTVSHLEREDMKFRPGEYVLHSGGLNGQNALKLEVAISASGITYYDPEPFAVPKERKLDTAVIAQAKVLRAFIKHGDIYTAIEGQDLVHRLSAFVVHNKRAGGVVGCKYTTAPDTVLPEVQAYSVNAANGVYSLATSCGTATINNAFECENTASTTADYKTGPGSSGSPIFVSKDGALFPLGVHSFAAPSVKGAGMRNFCVPFPDGATLDKHFRDFC